MARRSQASEFVHRQSNVSSYSHSRKTRKSIMRLSASHQKSNRLRKRESQNEPHRHRHHTKHPSLQVHDTSSRHQPEYSHSEFRRSLRRHHQSDVVHDRYVSITRGRHSHSHYIPSKEFLTDTPDPPDSISSFDDISYPADSSINDPMIHEEDPLDFGYTVTANGSKSRSGRRRHVRAEDMERILSAVRHSYQEQVDQVIAKWKVLLDRAHRDVEKYRSLYKSERAHTKKLQTMSDQLRSKLLKYKGKDTENQLIITDLQQRLNELYDDLTEITTPSQTPRRSHTFGITPRFTPRGQPLGYPTSNRAQPISLKPKLPLLSPRRCKIQNSSNPSNPASNHTTNPTNQSMDRNGTGVGTKSVAKSPLKSCLPPPTTPTSPLQSETPLTLQHGMQHATLSLNLEQDPDEEDGDDHIVWVHKIAKTRDDLRKILDSMEDELPQKLKNEESSHFLPSSQQQDEEHLLLTDVITNQCISVTVKFKDRLFKRKTSTIRVSPLISMEQFVAQLCDSVNIDSDLIQLQHHSNIIDIGNREILQSSLSSLDIDSFDAILVFIDYHKLLKMDGQNGSDDVETMKGNMECHEDGHHGDAHHGVKQREEEKEGYHKTKSMSPSVSVEDMGLGVWKQFESLIRGIDTRDNLKFAKQMLSLKTMVRSFHLEAVGMEMQRRLWRMVVHGILEQDPYSMCNALCGAVCEFMHCHGARLYFKWNHLVFVLYPQIEDDSECIVIDLNSDQNEEEMSSQNSMRLLLIEMLKEEDIGTVGDPLQRMKCAVNPLGTASNFDSEIKDHITSTLMAPLSIVEDDCIGVLQVIDKVEESEDIAGFTVDDKRKLEPLTGIFAVVLHLIYLIFPKHNIFSPLQNRDRRSVSRSLPPHNANHLFPDKFIPRTRGVSRAVPEDVHSMNVVRALQLRPRDVSRNASPIFVEHLSNASSVKSQTPIFTPTIHTVLHSKPSNKRYPDRIVHNENVMTRSVLKRDDQEHFETDEEPSGDSDRQHLNLVIHVSEVQDENNMSSRYHHHGRIDQSASGNSNSPQVTNHRDDGLMAPPISTSMEHTAEE